MSDWFERMDKNTGKGLIVIDDKHATRPDDPQVLGTRVMVHGDQVVMLEERRWAASYLRKMVAAVPEVAEPLTATAARYIEATAVASDLWPWGYSVGPEAQQGLADAGTRRAFAQQIRVARAQETRQ